MLSLCNKIRLSLNSKFSFFILNRFQVLLAIECLKANLAHWRGISLNQLRPSSSFFQFWSDGHRELVTFGFESIALTHFNPVFQFIYKFHIFHFTYEITPLKTFLIVSRNLSPPTNLYLHCYSLIHPSLKNN